MWSHGPETRCGGGAAPPRAAAAQRDRGRGHGRRQRRRPCRRIRLAGAPHGRGRQHGGGRLRPRAGHRRDQPGERPQRRPGVRWIEPASAIERRRPLPRVLDRREEPRGRAGRGRPPAGAAARSHHRRDDARVAHAGRRAGQRRGAASRTSATTGASWSSSRTPPTSSPAPTRNDGGSDIYLFDAADGGLRRVSVTSAGEQPAIGESATPAISGTGRVVAFSSTAAARRAARPSARRAIRRSVFVRDLVDGVTRRISASLDRDGPNGESYYPAISGDGRRVAFVSTATNLDDDARARRQENVYLHDDRMPKLKLLSRSATGGAADGASRLSRGERGRPLRALQLGRVEPPLHRSLRACRPTSTW